MSVSRRTTLKLGLGLGLPSVTAGAAVATCGPGGATPPASTAESGCRPLPLEAVRLTGGPLRQTQDLNGAYLKALDPDRMLAYYRERAGLVRRAEPYGGWDGGGRNLTGHIAGHYLSAVSLMWAATGDEEYRRRADYIVDELALVQGAHGDGYLCALEGAREAMGRLSAGEIESRSFDLNGLWSPWYTMHKTFAGLRDAWRHTGNRKALDVEVAYAEWAETILAPLDHAQLQHMMNTEFGGMNEVFVDLYEDTRNDLWLRLARKFEHDDFLGPLRHHRDNLAGKHGNTAVPKLIGSADRYRLTGDLTDLTAALFFWDTVVNSHTFATGGHGKDEYFGPADRLSTRIDGRTAETCNIYNMLKLTRQLFAIDPHPRFADFHERALFNHILGSMDPEDGSTCYMVPVGRGVGREYQDMAESFTCCVGSGMESHALHASGIFYEQGRRLYVNLFAPCVAEWAAMGARLTMDTEFPLGEQVTLRVEVDEPVDFTLYLRRPRWAGDGFAVRLNDRSLEKALELADSPHADWHDERSQYTDGDTGSSDYVGISREWRSGDTLVIDLPKSLYLEATQDDPRKAAVMWGPLVLAGDLGEQPERKSGSHGAGSAPPPVPVIVAAEAPVESWLEPVDRARGVFRTVGAARLPTPADEATRVTFRPFHRTHRRLYAAYWDFFTDEEWQAQKRAYAEEAEFRRRLEAATIAVIEPGETYSERDFNYRGGDDASSYRIQGKPSRRARDWFAYDVPVATEGPVTLILDLYSDDRRHSPADYRILIDGEELADHSVRLTEPPRFFATRFPVPEDYLAGRDEVTLRFEAKPGSQIPAILGVRLVRGTPEDFR